MPKIGAWLRSIVWALLSAILLASGTGSTARSRQGSPQVRVAIDHGRQGWTVRYDFDVPSPVWYFERSRVDWADGLPWRPRSFRVATPGVILGRAGHFDFLSRADGRPLARVIIHLRPYTRPLRADYRPALSFSDGGTALYAGAFAMRSAPSIKAVASLPTDPADRIQDAPYTALIVHAPGERILADGKVSRTRASLRLADDTSYIYVGEARPAGAGGSTSIVDPGLPAWLRTELTGLLPKLLRLYADRLGQPHGAAPTVLAAWQGANEAGYSQSGGVVGEMVALSLSGRALLVGTPPTVSATRRLFAHEIAHLWLGNIVDVSRRSDAWITEGGADFLATQALASLLAGYDGAGNAQKALDECIRLNGSGNPLVTAEDRGEFQVVYACGSLLYFALDRAARRGDPQSNGFTVVRTLIDRHRGSGYIDAQAWLDSFGAAAGSEARQAAQGLIQDGATNPIAAWGSLLSMSGFKARVNAGRLVIE